MPSVTWKVWSAWCKGSHPRTLRVPSVCLQWGGILCNRWVWNQGSSRWHDPKVIVLVGCWSLSFWIPLSILGSVGVAFLLAFSRPFLRPLWQLVQWQCLSFVGTHPCQGCTVCLQVWVQPIHLLHLLWDPAGPQRSHIPLGISQTWSPKFSNQYLGYGVLTIHDLWRGHVFQGWQQQTRCDSELGSYPGQVMRCQGS